MRPSIAKCEERDYEDRNIHNFFIGRPEYATLMELCTIYPTTVIEANHEDAGILLFAFFHDADDNDSIQIYQIGEGIESFNQWFWICHSESDCEIEDSLNLVFDNKLTFNYNLIG